MTWPQHLSTLFFFTKECTSPMEPQLSETVHSPTHAFQSDGSKHALSRINHGHRFFGQTLMHLVLISFSLWRPVREEKVAKSKILLNPTLFLISTHLNTSSNLWVFTSSPSSLFEYAEQSSRWQQLHQQLQQFGIVTFSLSPSPFFDSQVPTS